MMKKTLVPLLVLAMMAFAVLPMAAQTRKSNINEKVGKADKLILNIARSHFDSTYVALPAYKWMVFTSFNGNHSKYHLRVPMPNQVDAWDEEFVEQYPVLKNTDIYTYDMDLHSGTQSLSLGLAYRTLRLKYSFNVSKGNDRQLSIESLGSRFGFLFDYRRTKRMKGSMYDVKKGLQSLYTAISDEASPDAEQLIKDGTAPIDQRYNNYTLLHLQGHYVFNYKRFSYSAGRSGARIQKKSAGSPIALIDFYQSRAKFEKTFIVGENERYKTWKLSIGGGYGYNWTPNAGKFLLHASVMPSVNLFRRSSYHTTPVYPDNYEDFTDRQKELYQENIEQSIKDVKDMVDETPRLTLNVTARLSATWNINEHYVLGAYGSLQHSNFSNKQDYSIRENFYSGSIYLGYRF